MQPKYGFYFHIELYFSDFELKRDVKLFGKNLEISTMVEGAKRALTIVVHTSVNFQAARKTRGN